MRELADSRIREHRRRLYALFRLTETSNRSFSPLMVEGLDSYPFIRIAWLMYAAWELADDLWGNPLWRFMRTSPWGLHDLRRDDCDSGSWAMHRR